MIWSLSASGRFPPFGESGKHLFVFTGFSLLLGAITESVACSSVFKGAMNLQTIGTICRADFG